MNTHEPVIPETDSKPSAAREKAVAVSGVLVADKPEGITSFDAAARVKRLFKLKKTGHCGTLDPFATGVLIVCINEATRIVDQLLNQDKVYRFTARFGTETDTLDKTGEVVATREVPAPSIAALDAAMAPFRGSYVQRVPRFSAVRVGGRRLYELSRKGVEVERPEREVKIRSLDLCSVEWPDAVFEVCCSKGTYVRQLASDIGDRLGCGAHVRELRRLAVGPFDIGQAVRLEELAVRAADDGRPPRDRIVSMADALAHLPEVRIESVQALARLRNGQIDPGWESELRARFDAHSGAVRLIATENRLAALWWPKAAEDGSRRLRVFAF